MNKEGFALAGCMIVSALLLSYGFGLFDRPRMNIDWQTSCPMVGHAYLSKNGAHLQVKAIYICEDGSVHLK